MPTPFWIYRTGRAGIDKNRKRYLFSWTWVSTDPPHALDAIGTVLSNLSDYLVFPFGFGAVPKYGATHFFGDQVWPYPLRISGSTVLPFFGTVQLNAAAPEACFRLQRVGAAGGLGRILFPIPDDAWYTDLPHRRHINTAPLQALLDVYLTPFIGPYSGSGRTYRSCIFHRRTQSYELVTDHRLLENPVRVWQRWRTYDYVGRHLNDAPFVPDEMGWDS